ncbi:LYR motif-containing protein 5B-like [Clavelina lepadiformis]|uniref:LYR motif-containing protein 5 n=1 Tax=Clavelina lepadiformis TaxID=159417 RepID=A0ABP0FY03_CLALP
MELRRSVKQLYKTLIFMGREYPKGGKYFRDRCHAVFVKNKDIDDPDKIKQMIAQGEYVVKELEALYRLKKYRTLRKRYYDTETFEETIIKNIRKFDAE